MPTLTVDLAKTYSLSLKESKATPVDWAGIAGKTNYGDFSCIQNGKTTLPKSVSHLLVPKAGYFFWKPMRSRLLRFCKNCKHAISM